MDVTIQAKRPSLCRGPRQAHLLCCTPQCLDKSRSRDHLCKKVGIGVRVQKAIGTSDLPDGVRDKDAELTKWCKPNKYGIG